MNDASRIDKRGSGVLAWVTVGVKKLPPLCWIDFFPPTNGALNGRTESRLCDKLSVVNSGRANNLSGRAVRALCDRSRTVNEVRSANVVGSDVNLFLCN